MRQFVSASFDASMAASRSLVQRVSEADLKAMSANQKAELQAAHYLNTLAEPGGG